MWSSRIISWVIISPFSSLVRFLEGNSGVLRRYVACKQRVWHGLAATFNCCIAFKCSAQSLAVALSTLKALPEENIESKLAAVPATHIVLWYGGCSSDPYSWCLRFATMLVINEENISCEKFAFEVGGMARFRHSANYRFALVRFKYPCARAIWRSMKVVKDLFGFREQIVASFLTSFAE